MAKYKVLSTKKLEPGLVEKEGTAGIEIFEQEAIRIRPVLTREKWDEISAVIKSEKKSVAFTSRHAVHTVKKYLGDYINPFEINWEIFCLSGKTREALQEGTVQYGKIAAVADNAAELASGIINKGVKELVFFCGRQRRDALPLLLTEAGIAVNEIIVYETLPNPVTVNEDFDGILFFSPSAVASFFSVNQLKSGTACFAIGQTTASSIKKFTSNRIIVSEAPSQQAMMDSVNLFFSEYK